MFMSSELAALKDVNFVSVAFIGDLLGGECFVGMLNYAHIHSTNDWSIRCLEMSKFPLNS